MTLDEIKQHLSQLADCRNVDISADALYVLQVIQQAQSGEVSQSEAAELLNDVQTQLNIIQDAETLRYSETLSMLLRNLAAIAIAVH